MLKPNLTAFRIPALSCLQTKFDGRTTCWCLVSEELGTEPRCGDMLHFAGALHGFIVAILGTGGVTHARRL